MLFENNKLNNHYYDPSIPANPYITIQGWTVAIGLKNSLTPSRLKAFFELTIGERTIKRAVSATMSMSSLSKTRKIF